MRRGAYQLLIRLGSDETIRVGELGTFRFPAGFYVYTGSAMGGIDARVARHLSKSKRSHWHIDYLLEHCTIIRYAIEESSAPRECELNAAMLAMDGAIVPAKGFGSSDCKCRSHLVYFEWEPRLAIDGNIPTRLSRNQTQSRKGFLIAKGRNIET